MVSLRRFSLSFPSYNDSRRNRLHLRPPLAGREAQDVTLERRRLDLKTFLIVALVFAFPFLFVIAGVALFRGH